MNTYLTIMVTVLVATQLIRITQNHFNLRKNKEMIDAELKELGNVTKEDLDMKRFNEETLTRVLPKLEEYIDIILEDEEEFWDYVEHCKCEGECDECNCGEH